MFLVKWLKLDPTVPDAFIPRFAHEDDLGMDLHVFGDHDLAPGESRDLPSGLAVEMPPGFGCRIVHRSSAPREWGLSIIEGTIDPGFRGELKTYVENRNWRRVRVPHGTRLAQIIPVAKVRMDSAVVEALSPSIRGSAGFGSTGSGVTIERPLTAQQREQLKYRDKLRREMVAAYGGACVCCGESDLLFLSLDHINGGGTKERTRRNPGGWTWYRQLRQQGWPPGYQVLCFNCNAAKERGICPHRVEKA